MKIVNVVQGSNEWHEERAKRFTASEASAMMGASKYMTRDALLALKATGVQEEVTSGQNAIFQRGHDAEAAARPIAEAIAGEDFYPCTCEDDSGTYLASMDGLDIVGLNGFEHKLINNDLREATASTLSDHYKWQMDHQMMVTGAEKILFMASDGTESDCVWFWYERDESRIDQLVSGWSQFAEDLKTYTPRKHEHQPKGSAPSELMPIYADVLGEVKATNLPDVKERAMAVFGSINRDLQTDEDFANAEATVKWCKATEDKLSGAKESALAKTQTIAELFSTIDYISDEARKIRLELDKLVKERKQQRKMEIATAAKQSLGEYIAKLNTERCEGLLPTPPADFNGAMKGKRTIATLQDAADNEVARVKIMAKQTAELIETNLKAIDFEKYGFLFRDLPQLVLRDNDFVKLTVKDRIEKHKADEETRVEAEAQRRADQKIAVERAEQQRKEAEAERVKKEAEEQAEAEAKRVEAEANPAQQSQSVAESAAAAPSRVETQTSRPAKLKTPLSDYERGFIDGLCAFAEWSKEGLSVEQAIERFTRQHAA